jgi:cell wall-associated NlpC family hydrolase
MLAVPLCLLLVSACAQGTHYPRSSREVLSVILAGAPRGSSSTGSTGSSGSASPAGATASARRVIGTADRYVGVRYTWGGNTPSSGFDCSGFTRYVFAEQGVRLPRTSREQAAAGRRVVPRVPSLRQGDLMLFAESGKRISHVAIYAGGGRIIHSSSSGGGVRYDDLDTRRGRWFVSRMVAARRLVADGRSLVQALDLLAQPGLPLDPPDRAPAP